MTSRDQIQRSILPIPDAQYVGVTTYDAKDPDTKFPPIERLLPPKGAPNVLVVLLVAAAGVYVAFYADGSNVPLLVAFALLGFVGTAAAARLTERRERHR